MLKRVKISLFSTVIFFILVVSINLMVPILRNQQRTIDIFIVAFISSLIYYFVTNYLIKRLEEKDEKKEEK